MSVSMRIRYARFASVNELTLGALGKPVAQRYGHGKAGKTSFLGQWEPIRELPP